MTKESLLPRFSWICLDSVSDFCPIAFVATIRLAIDPAQNGRTIYSLGDQSPKITIANSIIHPFLKARKEVLMTDEKSMLFF